MQALQQALVALLLTLNAYAAEPPTVHQLVDQYGGAFGVATSTLNSVINCESGGRQYKTDGTLVIGKAGEIGLAQFMPSTFAAFSKEYGQPLDIYNREHQVLLMSWAFSKGYAHHWSCYKKML